MERRRVVHYVKERASHDVPSFSRIRPLTPSSLSLSSEDGSTMAPLATIESDVTVEVKHRNGQYSVPSSWKFVRRPMSEISETHSLTRASTTSTHQTHSQKRPLQLTSARVVSSVLRRTESLNEGQKQKWEPRKRRLPERPSSTPLSSTPLSVKKLNVPPHDLFDSFSSCTCDSSSLLSSEENCPVHFRQTFSDKQIENSTNSSGALITVNRSRDGCKKKLANAKVACTTLDSKYVFHNSISGHHSLSKNHQQYSHYLSTSPVSPCTNLHSQNRTDSYFMPNSEISLAQSNVGTKDTSVSSDVVCTDNISVPSKSKSQRQIYRHPLNSDSSRRRDSGLGSEASSEPSGDWSYCTTERESPHSQHRSSENFGGKGSHRTSADPGTRFAQSHGTTQRTNAKCHHRNSENLGSNDSQPTSNDSGTRFLQTGDEQETRTIQTNTKYRKNFESGSKCPDYTRNVSYCTGSNDYADCDRTPVVHIHSTSLQASPSNHLHVRLAETAEGCKKRLDCIPEFKSNWKRNSMRLATQGYTSMSDLTKSIECLGLEEEKVKDDEAQTSCRHMEIPNFNSLCSSAIEKRDYPDEDSNSDKSGLSDVSLLRDISVDSEAQSDITRQAEEYALCDIMEKTPKQTDTHSVKRPSFKLASFSVADVWFLEEDYDKLMTFRNQNSLTEESTEKPKATNDFPTRNQDGKSHVSDRSPCQLSQLEERDDLESVNKIKRRSFMLATSSMSDLTCDIDEVDSPSCLLPSNEDSKGEHSKRQRPPMLTPETPRNRLRESSFSSNRLNSSFGSYYSCQSTEPDKSSPPVLAGKEAWHQRSAAKDLTRWTAPGQRLIAPGQRMPSANLNSLHDDCDISGDSSFYTARDSSFVLGDDSLSNTSPYSDCSERSPRTQVRQWSRRTPYRRPEEIPQEKSGHGNNVGRANSLPTKVKSTKHVGPINNMLQCYTCGLGPGAPASSQMGILRGRKHTKSEHASSGKRDNIKSTVPEEHPRSYSTPPSRVTHRPIDSVSSAKNRLVQRQISEESDRSSRNQLFSVGLTASQSSDSILSLKQEYSWQDTRRGPPSLGRPRRKLYAGFDSQPLPIDSFISDSSSAYSEALSCSSRGGSRSEEIEKSYRSSDLSDYHSTHNRAASSSAYRSSDISDYHSTRSRPISNPTTPIGHVPGDQVFDIFTFTDKRSSLRENNHNLYISRDNSFLNTGYRDNFSEKNFSNESLTSFLSDATATNMEQYDSADFSNENMKRSNDSIVAEGRIKVNNSAVLRNEKRPNDLNSDERLNNSRDLEVVSRLSNPGLLTTVNRDETRSQYGALKASASASAIRPKLPPKLQYFSSKDILDLLMTSEKNTVTTLEKQAHKVCKVILCCNEMENSRPVGKEYRF